MRDFKNSSSFQNGYCGDNITANANTLSIEDLAAIDTIIPPKNKTDTIKRRAGKRLINKYRENFLELGDYQNMNSKLEDVFIGSSRLCTGNSIISSRLLFRLMRELPEISSKSVFEWVNTSRPSDEQIGERYSREIAERLRGISQALDFYIDTGFISFASGELIKKCA